MTATSFKTFDLAAADYASLLAKCNPMAHGVSSRQNVQDALHDALIALHRVEFSSRPHLLFAIQRQVRNRLQTGRKREMRRRNARIVMEKSRFASPDQDVISHYGVATILQHAGGPLEIDLVRSLSEGMSLTGFAASRGIPTTTAHRRLEAAREGIRSYLKRNSTRRNHAQF